MEAGFVFRFQVTLFVRRVPPAVAARPAARITAGIRAIVNVHADPPVVPRCPDARFVIALQSGWRRVRGRHILPCNLLRRVIAVSMRQENVRVSSGVVFHIHIGCTRCAHENLLMIVSAEAVIGRGSRNDGRAHPAA